MVERLGRYFGVLIFRPMSSLGAMNKTGSILPAQDIRNILVRLSGPSRPHGIEMKLGQLRPSKSASSTHDAADEIQTVHLRLGCSIGQTLGKWPDRDDRVCITTSDVACDLWYYMCAFSWRRGDVRRSRDKVFGSDAGRGSTRAPPTRLAHLHRGLAPLSKASSDHQVCSRVPPSSRQIASA
jgi:hypothetical protein